MKCMVCRFGETAAGAVTVTLERGESLVVVKGVPGEVCDSCGEYWLSEEVNATILSQAETVIATESEVEVVLLRFQPNSIAGHTTRPRV